MLSGSVAAATSPVNVSGLVHGPPLSFPLGLNLGEHDAELVGVRMMEVVHDG